MSQKVMSIVAHTTISFYRDKGNFDGLMSWIIFMHIFS